MTEEERLWFEKRREEQEQNTQRWRRKFAWQVAFYSVLIVAVAASIVAEQWAFRARIGRRFHTDPIGTVIQEAEIGAAVVICLAVVGLIARVLRDTRRHEAQMQVLAQRRRAGKVPPLSPEERAQRREQFLVQLRSWPPEMRAQFEATLEQTLQRFRAECGSRSETDAEIAELEELMRQARETG